MLVILDLARFDVFVCYRPVRGGNRTGSAHFAIHVNTTLRSFRHVLSLCAILKRIPRRGGPAFWGIPPARSGTARPSRVRPRGGAADSTAPGIGSLQTGRPARRSGLPLP